LGQFNRALEIWEEYLTQDDQNITVLTRVADAYRKVRNFHKSKETYLRVLEMEADNPYALIGLGHLHYDFKEFRDALHYWERMVEVHRDNVDIRVLTSIGNCHRKLKTYEDGIYFFNRALDKQPDNFYALFGMADCYRGLGNSQKSLDYWNRILEKDPNNKGYLDPGRDAYRQLADYDNAEDHYKRALEIEFDMYAVIGMAIVYRSRENIKTPLKRSRT
jgi:tetratricopeptide (TPR) repeat protein